MTITFSTLGILMAASVMLHVTEEFLYPDGFEEWYARLVPPKKPKGNKTGFLVWINALMMFVCVVYFYYGDTQKGYLYLYIVSTAAAVNACYHIWGVLKLKAYSPGVITGVLLYIPLFIIGTKQLVCTGELPLHSAIVAFVASVGYHIWSVIRQGK